MTDLAWAFRDGDLEAMLPQKGDRRRDGALRELHRMTAVLILAEQGESGGRFLHRLAENMQP